MAVSGVRLLAAWVRKMQSRLSRHPRRERRAARRLSLGLACGIGVLAAGDASGSIVGVCPDGSVFVVQRRESIPCQHAKEVKPDEVPPLRPEYLPEPYTWRLYHESVDPHNPYNMIDSARKVRELQRGAADARATPPQVGAAPPGLRASSGVAPDALGLTDGEVRDLFFIVELSQEDVPAAFVKERADGRERLRVALAYSPAFQTRFDSLVRGSDGLAGSRVLLFTAVAKQPESFFANFTFTQGHFAFQPDRRDPRQLGLLHGQLGEITSGEALLGYVVVPSDIDLAVPCDVYWNDRRTTATFASAS